MISIWIIFMVLMASMIATYPYWQRQLAIKRWYKSLSIPTHLNHFQRLFLDVDGFFLSHQSRIKHQAIEYTYGEIDFISFTALLSMAKPDNNTVFYDLGSGIGKAVLACAMVFQVKKSCGIEVLTLLHEAALQQQGRLAQLPDYKVKAQSVCFLNANFLQIDIRDASLIFINATAFFGETWSNITQHLTQVDVGTTIITISKPLRIESFNVIKTTRVEMSWGIVKAYIHRRMAENPN